MTIVRHLTRFLDRPGGRRILGLLATWHAKLLSGFDMEVFFDEVWLHHVENQYWATSVDFNYYSDSARKWSNRTKLRHESAKDWWFHHYQPQPGDVIVDIGAGLGEHIPTFSKSVGPKGSVLAVEAHPDTYTMLERTVSWNRFSNVSCIHKAIMGETGQVFITTSDRYISNVVQMRAEDNPNVLPVDGVPLDEICQERNIDRIDLIKMNIEGAECDAMRGMQKALRNTRFVCIACHDFRADRGDGEEFRTKAIVADFLRDHGFHVSARDDDSRQFVRDHLYGWNRMLVKNVGESHDGAFV